ncbi:arginine--tRNA ligase [Spongiivirga citrea]|uniref:Arginine--tRNA ligase n=1 Tax=Spongiivirga citrea TaxID=1481457 RepID=A0A6M0CL57_9FLAO|nr:arginine--tRNA ligase [Spongiivirga citrea]NER16157.1 arginine--tRNA ligase [Spongiivirga citrea]
MLQEVITNAIKQLVKNDYDVTIDAVEFQSTRKDFEGDITVVIFQLLKYVKTNPVQLGETIGVYLKTNTNEVVDYNVVKGFLNLVIADGYYLNYFNQIQQDEQFGHITPDVSNGGVLVEYSSPNTNKPLHLGHIRNNLLGYSVAQIQKAAGKKVIKTQIINDRGIHICKSMLAWQKFGNGATPDSEKIKGDKLVGNYYVRFDQEYKKQVEDLMVNGLLEDQAKKEAPILQEAQKMLRKWEQGDEEVVALWKMMNQWVYDGFDVTYKALGVDFDSFYYESDTYLLGKDVVESGLEKGVFYRKEDGSVWIDLTDDGLDEKIVLRSDGTAVYMTQDIGTAIQRVNDNPEINSMVYTVGNEQDYHFKVLFLILKKLGFGWAENLYHLSYGMVDLPSGKMKSREGTVVDADDLIQNMAETAGEISRELGKLEDYTDAEKLALYQTIGLAALKYYILKVDPKKRILFDPKESIDFQGNTGPFVQYTYARIQSVLRKVDYRVAPIDTTIDIDLKEKYLLKRLEQYPDVVQQAAAQYSPALIANYTYDLVREFNSFFQNIHILGEKDAQKRAFRIQLAGKVGKTIKLSCSLLGIDVPERM